MLTNSIQLLIEIFEESIGLLIETVSNWQLSSLISLTLSKIFSKLNGFK